MSDKNVSLLEYLLTNSELARSLEQPVSLEELLAHQTDQAHCVSLLSRLTQLAKDRLKLSNCLLDGTLPYDSLIGLSNDDLVQLRNLCDYLILPSDLCKKLNETIKNGIDINKYNREFNPSKILDWVTIGDLRGVKLAWEKTYILNKSLICSFAANYGHLDCLQWLHEHGCTWDKSTCSSAASNGHLDCLQYAHEHGCPWDEWTCTYAAEFGRLNCLQYAHVHGCPWDVATCIYAANGGYLNCLRYAHEHGCPWNKTTCSSAAQNGHLDCLQWLHEQGCPWDEETCAYAAGGGHLACLQYAHTNGCPWDVTTCRFAVGDGHLACLEYAHTHGCPLDSWTYKLAMDDGHLDCLEYLKKNMRRPPT